VAGKPETPAFTYDDARSKLYLEYNQSADVGAETIDNAQGALWLANDRGFTLTDDGYYLQTVREDVVNNIGLPVLSNDLLKATLTAGSHHVFGRSLESTPQRLNFSITQPTDVTTPAFKCYKLQRRDNIATIDLGYISPDSGISFSYNASTKVVSISGLDSSTPASYRLKFTGYQDTQVQTSLTESGSSTASVSQSKSNMTGLDFDGNDTLVITLVAGTDTTFHAADFWLEKKIFEINTSTTSDDIYATVRCFDVFDRNGNAIQTGVITGTSDYLDAFPNGVSSGVVSDSTPTGVPTYLKFLRESNNFFFAVGTESTPDNRYSSTNKADSYLFISEYNNPRSWPLSGYLEFEDSITGLASYPGELIVWTQNGVYRVTGSRYDQMRKSKLATTEGLPLNQEKSIALVNRYLVWVSQSGICFYNGESVVNLSRGRIPNFSMSGNSLHASQFNDIYYVLDSTETGYSVDFSLEGFPISRVDLTEGDTNAPANSSAEVLPPVLVYRPSVNRLYSRRGIIGGSSTKNSWSYKTRGFDGGAFGSLKLVRNVTINGEGSGYVQIYLDGKPVFKNSSNVATPKQVTITETTRTEPARIYVPASSDTIYGLSIADVWSVEITNWEGVVDWIDTEYEIISGG
jgi:hypothetical protein